MLRASLRKSLAPDKYVIMFILIGLILGSAFHIFNSEGRELVTKVIGALNSPDLFYLLLSFSGVLLCSRNVIKGPILETSLFTKNVVLFPGETAIEAMKSLSALLLGLVAPLYLYSGKLGFTILAFFSLVVLSSFSASILFTMSYRETCPDWISSTVFRIMNLFLVIVLSGFFWWQYVRELPNYTSS